MAKLPPLKNREKLVKALARLGYEISTKSGKGVHYKLKMGSHSLTIPKHLESIDTRHKFENWFIKYGGDLDALIAEL